MQALCLAFASAPKNHHSVQQFPQTQKRACLRGALDRLQERLRLGGVVRPAVIAGKQGNISQGSAPCVDYRMR